MTELAMSQLCIQYSITRPIHPDRKRCHYSQSGQLSRTHNTWAALWHNHCILEFMDLFLAHWSWTCIQLIWHYWQLQSQH